VLESFVKNNVDSYVGRSLALAVLRQHMAVVFALGFVALALGIVALVLVLALRVLALGFMALLTSLGRHLLIV